jgi:cell division septum initiation protein DivIVA
MIMRAVAVAAVAASPLAALQADAAVTTGDATANGPGVAVENTGGNVEFGVGHSESKVVIGDGGGAAPLAVPNGVSTLSKPAVDPNAAAVARAKALVADARARAQAQIDAARLKAEQAVEQAKSQSDNARANSDQQSQDARTRAEQNSASASSSSD